VTHRSDDDASRRRRFRRRRVGVLTVLGLVVLLAAYAAGVGLAPLPAAAVTAQASRTITPAAVQPDFPSWATGGAVGMVGDNALLAQYGNMGSVPIASITKTVTALVLLQAHPIAAGAEGPTITFTQADVDIWNQVMAEDGSWAPVYAGEQLTEKQALEAMLLPSANNYAISLAIWGFGSVGAFLTAANRWTADHGLTATHITDPSGLDPGSVSDPVDLIAIGKMVLANPVLAQIVAMPQQTFPGSVGVQQNTNALVGVDDIDGIKTGSSDQAGYCLLFSATVTLSGHRVTLVGVVLGGSSFDDLWAGTPPLLKSIEAGFHDVSVSTTADYGTVSTAWGQTARLKSTGSGGVFVFSDTPVHVSVATKPISTAHPGASVGTVAYSGGGQHVSRTLTVSTSLTDPGFGWRFTHPLRLVK
jgi:D-alanyl-D-alanine carboxypeptidase (penicillin-binding protein 5/6)